MLSSSCASRIVAPLAGRSLAYSAKNLIDYSMGNLNMPIDLVLVRHGDAEGNIAFSESKKGNNSFFTSKFMATHESKWRLTPTGRHQAIETGKWIRDNVSQFFGAYLTSEYVRALETAALLDFPHATWVRDSFLRERNFGRLSSLTYEEREKRFSRELELRKRDAFYWKPPSGESLADVALRVDYIIASLSHYPLTPNSAIIVSHFNVMQVFRTRLEMIMQSDFEEKLIKVPDRLKIKNAAVIHYTRANPKTGEVAPTYRWRRIAVPWLKGEYANPQWDDIQYGYLTNETILKGIEEKVKIPA